jgi:RNA polymerase sigma factor (sigma-70 family)
MTPIVHAPKSPPHCSSPSSSRFQNSWDKPVRPASSPVMGPELFTRLMDEHAAALVLYARQWCATPEDVVQEALLKLATIKSSPEHPAAWLFRVVRNLAISAARRDSRRRKYESAAAARSPAWFVPGREAGLDGHAAALALEGLALEMREIIVAHLWGGLTFDEIGEVSGVSSSTAHRRYLAGLTILRERLGVQCPAKSPKTS